MKKLIKKLLSTGLTVDEVAKELEIDIAFINQILKKG
jgi:predicted transcriptional regulator